MTEPKWTYTCCWTDHSNGCPAADVDTKKYNRMPDNKETAQQFFHEFLAAKVRRGYLSQAEADAAHKASLRSDYF